MLERSHKEADQIIAHIFLFLQKHAKFRYKYDGGQITFSKKVVRQLGKNKRLRNTRT